MSSHSQLTLLFFLLALCAAPSHAADADPMRPPSAELAGGASNAKGKPQRSPSTIQSGYHLSAIRIAPEQRSATINGKRVAPGQRIGQAKVVAIQAGGVTLQQAGKRFTISLLPLSIKKPVEAKQP